MIICSCLINSFSYFSAIFIEITGLMTDKCHGDLSQNVTCFGSILLEPALDMQKSEF